MHSHFEHFSPGGHLRVTKAGAGIAPHSRCSHGEPGIFLHLVDDHDGRTQEVTAVLASCTAPAVFGAALASIEHHSGGQAAAEFLATLFATRDRTLDQLRSVVLCCEAGFNSGGREHTCDPAAPSA